jgi:hypothetical protein
MDCATVWQEQQRCDGARRKRLGRKDTPGQEVIIILALPIICGRLIRTAVARVAIVVTDGYWADSSLGRLSRMWPWRVSPVSVWRVFFVERRGRQAGEVSPFWLVVVIAERHLSYLDCRALSRNLRDLGLCHAAGLISTSKPRLRIRLASLAAARAGFRRAKWSAPRSW